ncbi:uncharacterized protein [Amphiura filiformis]|uniref:uncharacterized protein n=1 Tax=Amphiura filiformis TaxID=82378 RepID=UPI003B22355F
MQATLSILLLLSVGICVKASCIWPSDGTVVEVGGSFVPTNPANTYSNCDCETGGWKCDTVDSMNSIKRAGAEQCVWQAGKDNEKTVNMNEEFDPEHDFFGSCTCIAGANGKPKFSCVGKSAAKRGGGQCVWQAGKENEKTVNMNEVFDPEHEFFAECKCVAGSDGKQKFSCVGKSAAKRGGGGDCRYKNIKIGDGQIYMPTDENRPTGFDYKFCKCDKGSLTCQV